VLITAAVPVDAIRDAATLGSVGEARLDQSAAYLSIGPISNVLDTLTLMTVGQHIAILLWAIGIFALWRVLRARRRATRVRREVVAALLFLTGVVLVYVVGALMPRPMAELVASDGSVVAIDFHSHTEYSHDGRPGWTEDDVRNWHRGAGFDVAYITDHATFEGAERGVAGNASQAGEGTILLQGLEVFYRGEHVNILSAGRRYRGITTPNLKDVDEQALQLAGILAATSPVLIETVPANLDKVPATTQNAPGVNAIEIVDGAPRGLAQTREERAKILHIADSLNLALVVGSDNHGWGRTAPGWTLMRIPGWRGMSTDSLSRRIEDVLRAGRHDATRAVERRVAGGANPLSLVFALPLVAWRMFTTLSADERVMWLIWTWGLVLLVRGLRAYRIRPSATT
jgi:predicted metal-dependent phosphoesterase TrpH